MEPIFLHLEEEFVLVLMLVIVLRPEKTSIMSTSTKGRHF